MSHDATSHWGDKLLHRIEKAVAKRASRSDYAEPVLSYPDRRQLESLDYTKHEKDRFKRVRLLMRRDARARREFTVTYCDLRLQVKKDLPAQQSRLERKQIENVRNEKIAAIRKPIFRNRKREDKDANAVLEQVLAELHWLVPIPVADYRPVPIKESHPHVFPRLRALNRNPPQYLYRTSSWEGLSHTNGHDEIHFHLPAAYKNGERHGGQKELGEGVLAPSIDDEHNGLGELIEKIGHRLLWKDRRNDPTLSWTSSLLFALVLALGRRAKEQRHIRVHIIDSGEVTSLRPTGSQDPEFFLAQDLLRELDIADWNGWNEWDSPPLRRPWYTHEWLSHHGIQIPRGKERFAYEADVEELIENGLFELVPHLKPPEKDDDRGLYDPCVYTRSVGHSEYGPQDGPKPFDQEELDLAYKLSLCFYWQHREMRNPITKCTERVKGSGKTKPLTTPRLNIFLDLLSMKSRPKQDPKFMDFTKSKFQATDLANLDFSGLARLANNLPEQAQSLDLARDAHAALGLPDNVPPTRVWCADENFNFECKWTRDEAKTCHIKNTKPKSKIPKVITDHLTGNNASTCADTSSNGDSQESGSTAVAGSVDESDASSSGLESGTNSTRAASKQDDLKSVTVGEDKAGREKSRELDESTPEGQPASKRQKVSPPDESEDDAGFV